MSARSDPLTEEELAACTTATDWLRRFLAKNPTMDALTAGMLYARSGLANRLGRLAEADMMSAQARLPVREMTPENRAALRETGSFYRRAREERWRELDAMGMNELTALSDPEFVVALLRRFRARGSREGMAGLVYSVNELDAEVRNGGFHQYYGNTGGEFVELAINGLRAMGCDAPAEIVERTVAIFRTRDANGTANRPDPEIRALDKSYFATDGETIGSSYPPNAVWLAMARYLRENLARLIE